MSACKDCKHRGRFVKDCPLLKEILLITLIVNGDAYAIVDSIETPDDFSCNWYEKKKGEVEE